MNPHADSVQQPSETFAAWLSREMPAGTVISDPAWWAPRIERALARFGTRPAADPRSLTAAEHQVLREAVWDSAEIVHPGIAAEPIQSGSAGEAELPSPYNIINGVWYYSAEQMRAAISRQAPAAPAAVDFEQWWLAEVAANGGVPIGADYKHWAKAGFELRGDARAPAAPAEAGRSDQWGRLYTTANTLVASIGYMGEIDSRADEVASLMDALHDLDGGQWMPGLTPAASPAAPTQALLGWTRYEKARKLNPAQWAELHQRNIRGENFDDMIDALPATTQPAQQDWKDAEAATIPKLTIQTRSTPTAPTWADLLFAFGGFLTSHEKRWVFSSRDDASPMVEAIREFAARECINLDATPPAEKQAAPSGEASHSAEAIIEQCAAACDEVASMLHSKAAIGADACAKKLRGQITVNRGLLVSSSDVNDAEDAARWRMLPAFLEEFQIDYVGLIRAIDAARLPGDGGKGAA